NRAMNLADGGVSATHIKLLSPGMYAPDKVLPGFDRRFLGRIGLLFHGIGQSRGMVQFTHGFSPQNLSPFFHETSSSASVTRVVKGGFTRNRLVGRVEALR